MGRRADPLAARNPRRKDLMGIVEWRDSELARLGVDVRVRHYADEHIVATLRPDVVIVATGGLPQNPELEAGDDLVVTAGTSSAATRASAATCCCTTTTARTRR